MWYTDVCSFYTMCIQIVQCVYSVYNVCSVYTLCTVYLLFIVLLPGCEVTGSPLVPSTTTTYAKINNGTPELSQSVYVNMFVCLCVCVCVTDGSLSTVLSLFSCSVFQFSALPL